MFRPVVGGVRDVEAAVSRVARVEREPEQALLAAVRDVVADVEEDACGVRLRSGARGPAARRRTRRSARPARASGAPATRNRARTRPLNETRALGALTPSPRATHERTDATTTRSADAHRRTVADAVRARRGSTLTRSCGLRHRCGAGRRRRSSRRSTTSTTITVLDTETSRLQALAARFDVAVYEGDGTQRSDLAAAGIGTADLVIACTSRDEVNLVAGMFARREARDATTVIRTSNVGVRRALARGPARRRLRRVVRARDGARDQPHPRRARRAADGRVRGRAGAARRVRRATRTRRRRSSAPASRRGDPGDSKVAAIIRGDDTILPGGDDRDRAAATGSS